MKTRMVSSATSFQRLQTSLQSPMPRLPRSNVYSTRDPANPSASVHRKRFFTPSLTLNISMRWLLESGLRQFAILLQNCYAYSVALNPCYWLAFVNLWLRSCVDVNPYAAVEKQGRQPGLGLGL